MRNSFDSRDVNISMTRDFADLAFGMADITAGMWQPMLKGVGRCQLEVATMSAKNTQAGLRWSRTVSRSINPFDIFAANVALWSEVTNNVTEATPRVTVALSQATEPVAAFEVEPRIDVPRNTETAATAPNSKKPAPVTGRPWKQVDPVVADDNDAAGWGDLRRVA